MFGPAKAVRFLGLGLTKFSHPVLHNIIMERLQNPIAARVKNYSRFWMRQLPFWAGGIAIALVAIFFARASTQSHLFYATLIQRHPVLAFLFVPLGFASLVGLTRRFFPGAEGSGIPQAIAACDSVGKTETLPTLSLRVAFGKALLTVLGLCVGASVGREGPTVQVGAAIMNKVGGVLRLSAPGSRRTLLLAGGAAGIAAAFNTPLAGILFAIEELSRSFEERTSGAALTQVIVAGIVSMAVLGNYTYFGHTSVSLALAQAWKPVLFCGVLGGLCGGGFSRFLLFFTRRVKERPLCFARTRPVLFAGLCGLALACLGLATHNTIFGTGYSEAKSLIEGTGALPLLFGPMKLLATALSYISGLPGGLFAPSLATGAGLGAQLAPFLPDSPAAAVVILGMVGYFTGVVQVPITATVIVMEMTDDQSLTLPLMATAFIAYAFSRLVCPTSLYRTLAKLSLPNQAGTP